MKRIIVSVETYERFKIYSEVIGKTMYESIDEALNFWMDTAGAADMFAETGYEIDPTIQHTGTAVTIN